MLNTIGFNKTFPNLLLSRGVALVLAREAVTAADLRRGLSDLDRFTAAHARSTITFIDAMIAVAVATIRDQAYLSLAQQHRLPTDLAAAWITEPSSQVSWIADAFRGECLLFPVPVAEDYPDPWCGLEGLDRPSALFRPWIEPRIRAVLFSAASVRLEQSRAIRLRQRSVIDAEQNPYLHDESFASLIEFDASSMRSVAVESATTHRIHRIAVRHLLDAQRGTPVPETYRIPTDGDHLPLVVTRTGTAGFTVTVDHAVPPPAIAMASDGTMKPVARRITTPMALTIDRFQCVVQVDAAPAPSPVRDPSATN